MKLLPILLILSIGPTAQQRPTPKPPQHDTTTITPAQYQQLLSEFRNLNNRIDTMQYRINLILLNQRK